MKSATYMSAQNWPGWFMTNPSPCGAFAHICLEPYSCFQWMAQKYLINFLSPIFSWLFTDGELCMNGAFSDCISSVHVVRLWWIETQKFVYRVGTEMSVFVRWVMGKKGGNAAIQKVKCTWQLTLAHIFCQQYGCTKPEVSLFFYYSVRRLHTS